MCSIPSDVADAALGAIGGDDVLGGDLDGLSRAHVPQGQDCVLGRLPDVNGLHAAHDGCGRLLGQVLEQDGLQVVLRHSGRGHRADHGALSR